MRVRPAAVAGQFYPADPVALAASVNALLATAPAGGRRPTAVIAPHAGYRYSEAVAGAAYARLAACRGEVHRVVVLGPAHHVRLRGDGGADVVLSDRPHAPEHAIETQLPFLLCALGPGITLLPVLVGATPPAAPGSRRPLPRRSVRAAPANSAREQASGRRVRRPQRAIMLGVLLTVTVRSACR